jgi:hypothetical protein
MTTKIMSVGSACRREVGFFVFGNALGTGLDPTEGKA